MRNSFGYFVEGSLNNVSMCAFNELKDIRSGLLVRLHQCLLNIFTNRKQIKKKNENRNVLLGFSNFSKTTARSTESTKIFIYYL